MSGPYRIEGPDDEGDYTVRRDDDFMVTWTPVQGRADRVTRELNRLHALAESRSGSPEGWPEGAERVSLRYLRGLDEQCLQMWEIDFTDRWASAPEYVAATRNLAPGLAVLARRKPKPVTRDVLAWDLEPGMKLADGTTLETVSLSDRGSRQVEFWTTSQRREVVGPSAIFSVLVEDSNG